MPGSPPDSLLSTLVRLSTHKFILIKSRSESSPELTKFKKTIHLLFFLDLRTSISLLSASSLPNWPRMSRRRKKRTERPAERRRLTSQISRPARWTTSSPGPRLFTLFTWTCHSQPGTVRKEIKCSKDSEILNRIVCDTIRITSSFTNFRVELRTISCSTTKYFVQYHELFCVVSQTILCSITNYFV